MDGNDSDAFFSSDDDSIWADPSVLAQLDSALPGSTQAFPPTQRPPPPPQKRPLAPPARNAQPILRPAQPPTKKPRLVPPARSTHLQQPPQANPFARKSVAGTRIDEEEEDVMPIITVRDGSGSYVAAPAAADGFDALKKWGEPSKANGIRPGASVAGVTGAKKVMVSGSGGKGESSGLSEKEKQELASLRAAKAELESELADARAKVDSVSNQLVGKTGEVAIVRRRLTKAEDSYKSQTEAGDRIRKNLEDRLEAKERELKAEVARMMVDQAFRRQEQETSARRPTSAISPWSSARPPKASSSHNNRAGQSPSIGRSGRPHAAPQSQAVTAPLPKPSFAGFKNAFGSPHSQPRKSRAEGSMPPPPLPTSGPSRKGKERVAMLVEGEGDDDESGDGAMASLQRWRGTPKMNDVEIETVPHGDEMGMISNHKTDSRAEILSTLFNHVTLLPLDDQSVLPSTWTAPSTLAHTAFSRPSTSRSYFGLSNRSHGSTISGITPQSNLDPKAPPVPPSAPTATPTFHFLTNLHLPSPISSLAYTQITRDLFLALGRSSVATEELILSLLKGLEGICRSLETEGLITALSAGLKLLAALVRSFEGFSRSIFRERNRGFLGLMRKTLEKYCRPTAIARPKVGKEKPRRVRRSATGKGKEVVGRGNLERERIELGDEGRRRLTDAVVEVLEGLAGSMGVEDEDAFSDFLITGTAVATLLDAKNSTQLLTRAVRFLALLACRPSLFRSLLAIKFYDASDVRVVGGNVPVLERIGTLFVKGAGKASFEQIYELDMGLLVLVTSLTINHSDAIVLLSASPSLIPELLDKLFKDARTVWDFDGSDVDSVNRIKLASVVKRLSTCVHLFYYFTCAPPSPLNIAEYFNGSTFSGLHDRFNVAFGGLAFASLPSWTIDTPEGITLTELGYLAQEIMEDVSPQEGEEIESCFVSPSDEDEMEQEEDEKQGGAEHGGESDEMVLIQDQP